MCIKKVYWKINCAPYLSRTVKISVYNLISLCMQKFGYAFVDTILKTVITSATGDLKAIEQKKVDVILSDKVNNKKSKKDLGHMISFFIQKKNVTNTKNDNFFI